MKFKPNYIVIPLIIVVWHWIRRYVASGILPLATLRELTGIFKSANSLLLSEVGFVALGLFVFSFCITLEVVPLLLFWNRFPRSERHFHVILGLFVLYGLLGILRAYFLGTYYSTNITMPCVAACVQLVVGFFIAVSLWVHHLHSAAIWAIIYLILLAVGFYATYYSQRQESVSSVDMIQLEEGP